MFIISSSVKVFCVISFPALSVLYLPVLGSNTLASLGNADLGSLFLNCPKPDLKGKPVSGSILVTLLVSKIYFLSPVASSIVSFILGFKNLSLTKNHLFLYLIFF